MNHATTAAGSSPSPADIILAIDNGTTYSTFVVYQNGKKTHGSFPGSGPVLPSVVLLQDDGTCRFGRQAENAATKSPTNVHVHFKRLLASDPDLKKYGGCDAVQITGMQLGYIWDVACKVAPELKQYIPVLGGTKDRGGLRIVVTCPATWNQQTQRRLREAGDLAGNGFHIDTVITEPVAASYDVRERWGNRLKEGDLILILDFGGGTFDISVMQFRGGTFHQLIGGKGDDQLGGLNVTGELFLMFCADAGLSWERAYDKSCGLQLNDPSLKTSDHRFILQAWQKLDEAKCDLAVNDTTTVFIETPKELLEFTVSRDEFVDRLRQSGFLDRFAQAIRTCVDGTDIDLASIEHVALVGGSALLPELPAIAGQLTGRPETDIYIAGDPRHTICDGAAVAIAYQEDSSLCLAGGLGVLLRDPDDPTVTHRKFFFGTGSSIAPDSPPVEALGQFVASPGRPLLIEVPFVEAKAGVQIPPPNGQAVLVPAEHVVELGSACAEVSLPKGSHPVQMSFFPDRNKNMNLQLSFPTCREVDAYVLPLADLGSQNSSTPQQLAFDVMLVLDCSGSMNGKPLSSLKAAISWFLRHVVAARDMRAGVISFGRHTGVVAPLGTHVDELTREVHKLDAGGGTPMDQALQMSLDHLHSCNGSDRHPFALLVTDGQPSDARETTKRAELLKDKAELFCVGVGDGVIEPYLISLASTPENYRFAAKPEDLQDIFEDLGTLFLDTTEVGR